MADRPGLAEFMTILRRGVHPPVREWRFWVIQAVVLIIAGVHILLDIDSAMETGAFPAGIPVALLILPTGYAALRYGLAGSAATGLWATLLWLPDLLLPHDEGHVGSDVINLALVNLVAFFVGHHIEAGRLAHERAQRATAEHLAADARYRQLFQTKQAPILVLDAGGAILDANPAAKILYGADLIGRHAADVTGETEILTARHRPVVCLPNGRDYRLDIVPLPAGTQRSLIFEDVTEERSEQRRVTQYAAAVVQAEEDQRQRLARELHDEPLQLFLHLARRLGDFGRIPGVPPDVADGLVEARRQALDAATRLRSLARGLRPSALDQLGFIAALSSLLADVEEEAGLEVDFDAAEGQGRLAPEVELGAFRIVQEAVRNTVRHAAAHRLWVAVTIQPDAVDLSVADDGCGFRPDGSCAPTADHLGLLGMRERARMLGGSLDIRTSPGEGTLIAASIPIRAHPRTAEPTPQGEGARPQPDGATP